MTSRRRRDQEVSSRGEPYGSWVPESDSDHRPRQTMTASQRPNVEQPFTSSHDKPHRSKRSDPTAGDLPAPHLHHHRTASKEQNVPFASSSSFYSVAQAQAQLFQTTATYVDSSHPTGPSRSHSKDPSKEGYSVRTHLKRKTEKRPSPSSDERILPLEHSKHPPSAKQHRDGHHSADTTSAPPLLQPTWVPPAPSGKEVASSSHRDKDRERRHAERARLKEEERARRKAQERSLLKVEERAREKASDAEEARQRDKGDDRERRRQKEKEKEKERGTKPRDRESRSKEEHRPPDFATGHPQPYSSNPGNHSRRAGHNDRSSNQIRQPYPDHIPSSSSSIALPMAQSVPQPPRHYTEPSRLLPPNPAGHEKKRHRSHRDQVPLQPNAQESGMSSSEQESGRERVHRRVDYKRMTGNLTDGPSGPSGSETERTGRERRKHHRPQELDQMKGAAEQKQSPNAVASAPQSSQSTAHVGPTIAPYKPQIVSIRAGQGPPDHQAPSIPPKTPAPDASSGRPHPSQPEPTAWRPPAAGNAAQGAYLQVPTELYGGSRNVGVHSAQSGYVPFPPNGHQPSAATAYLSSTQLKPTHAITNAFANPSSFTQYAPDSSRPPSIAPSLLTKHSATAPAVQGNPPPVPAKSYTLPSPRRHVSSLPANPQSEAGPPLPQKSDIHAKPPSGPNFAKLSVYRAPDPPVGGELIFEPSSSTPVGMSQLVAAPAPPIEEWGSRFPINEDTLMTSTATKQPPVNYALTTGPSRSSTFPLPSYISSPYDTPSLATHRPYPMPGDDTPRAPPLPIPEPRSSVPVIPTQITVAVQGVPTNQYYDPRSPKHSLTTPMPGLPSLPSQSVRPQVSPPQSRQQGLPQPTVLAAPIETVGEAESSRVSQLNGLASVGVVPNPMNNYSPSRSVHPSVSRASPATGAVTLTPKHSPSGRTSHRNGSTDTIPQSIAAAKHSPSSGRGDYLVQTSTASITQQSLAPSRPEMTPHQIRQNVPPAVANPEYPELNRYRMTLSSQVQYPSTQPVPVSIPATQTPLSYPNAGHTPYQPPRPSLQHIASPVLHDPGAAHRPQSNPQGPGMTSASAIAAAYRNGTYHSEMATRPPDSTTRVPSRAAPSPAPVIPSRQQQPTTSLNVRATQNMSAAIPHPPRGQTFPTLTNGRSTTQTSSHTRSASDPHLGIAQPSRVLPPGQTSAAPLTAPLTKALESHHISSPGEPEQLRTPSSLAPSMLRNHPLAPSFPASVAPSKEKAPLGMGIFKIFRSRSSPPKPTEPRPPVAPTLPGVRQRPRATSQTTIQAVAASVKSIVTPRPTNIQAPTPIVAPTPVKPAVPVDTTQERKSPSSKMFTSFRLVSRRYRTVSAASVEATDGTAPNTVVGGESTRSSTAGRPSPPLRDPVIATMDWRNREEAGQMAKGTLRRYRPGVTFDTENDVIADASATRPVRKPSRRHDSK